MVSEQDLQNMSPEEISALQKENCIFCKIVGGAIPAKTIYKDDICTAFLDINPASFGHILLVPNNHYQVMPQIPENELEHLAKVSKHLSQAALKSLKPRGIAGTTIYVANGAIAGQRAPHVIIHIIPRSVESNLPRMNIAKNQMDETNLSQIASALTKRISENFGVSVSDASPTQTIAKQSSENNSPIENLPNHEPIQDIDSLEEHHETKFVHNEVENELPPNQAPPPNVIHSNPASQEPRAAFIPDDSSLAKAIFGGNSLPVGLTVKPQNTKPSEDINDDNLSPSTHFAPQQEKPNNPEAIENKTKSDVPDPILDHDALESNTKEIVEPEKPKPKKIEKVDLNKITNLFGGSK